MLPSQRLREKAAYLLGGEMGTLKWKPKWRRHSCACQNPRITPEGTGQETSTREFPERTPLAKTSTLKDRIHVPHPQRCPWNEAGSPGALSVKESFVVLLKMPLCKTLFTHQQSLLGLHLQPRSQGSQGHTCRHISQKHPVSIAPDCPPSGEMRMVAPLISPTLEHVYG